MQPSLEMVVRVVNRAARRNSINEDWSSIGKLLDRMLTSDEKTAIRVATHLSEWMNRRDDITRSSFVKPFMRLYYESIKDKNDAGRKTTKRKASVSNRKDHHK